MAIERCRNIIRFSILLIVLSVSGCSWILDSLVDRALETKEERHVRKDKKRLREKRPLRYHKDRKDLKKHERRVDRAKSEKRQQRMIRRMRKRKEEREREKAKEAQRIKYDILPAPHLSERLEKLRLKYNRILKNMPEEEVLEIMGEPTTKRQNTWIYLLNRSERNMTVRTTEIHIRFSKGVVESKKVHDTIALTKKNSQPAGTADR